MYYIYPNKQIAEEGRKKIERTVKTSDSMTLYRLNGLKSIDYAFWKNSNEIVLQSGSTVYTLKTTTRSLKIVSEDIPLERYISGYYKDKIVFCAWENLSKTSQEDWGTEITVSNEQFEIIKRKKFKNTLKINSCLQNEIYLENAYDFLEEKYYLYNFETEILTEASFDVFFPYLLKGQNRITILKKEKKIFDIPRPNNIQNFWISKNEKNLIYTTNEGDIWVYLTNGSEDTK